MQALAIEKSDVDVIDDATTSPLGATDVEVSVIGVGVCGTDLALVSRARSVPSLPWIIGHEAVGKVTRTGDDVTSLAEGDLVALEPNYVDLTCDACKAGDTSRCEHRRSAGVSVPGYLVDRVVVPAEFAWKLPADTAVEDAVCIEPMSVAVAAVRRSGAAEGDRVLVLGAGAQGLFATMALKARGITPVITDLQDDRVELAVSIGATALKDQTGFTHLIDTTGSPAALHAQLDRLALGAQVTLVGENGKDLQISSQEIVQKQLRILGSFIYDHPVDFKTTIDLITSGEASPRTVVKNRATLEEAVDAIEAAPKKVGKTWIDLR